MANEFDQWSTIRPLIAGYPAWAGEDNQTRIAAYQTYEQIYWNIPESFKLIARGEDSKPIYVPAARTIIETMHRYTAPKLKVVVDETVGSDAEKAAAALLWTSFARRERFYGMFSANKRYGLIRGDWLFHILADGTRPEGARISIEPVDPARYFPIYEKVGEIETDTIVGCHLVDQVKGADGKDYIHRLTYRKTSGTGGPSPITVEEAVFEVDKWGGPGMDEQMVDVVRPVETLPDPIDQIPVYHIRNFDNDGDFGISELAGLERLLGAINQSISDEELELVMNGLGVYVTDAGTPIDEDTGEEVPWNLGPAKVVHTATGKKFVRVSGTTTVAPHQEHLKYLHSQLDLAASTPPAATGRVDVQVAESGIALALELAPVLSRAEEKELHITDVLTNMLFDLRTWFIAYESTNLGEALWLPAYGDKIPVNRKEKFEELMKLKDSDIVPASYVRAELKKLGYEFPDADDVMMNAILEEKMALAQIEADVTGARVDAELEGEELDETDEPVV